MAGQVADESLPDLLVAQGTSMMPHKQWLGHDTDQPAMACEQQHVSHARPINRVCGKAKPPISLSSACNKGCTAVTVQAHLM